MSIMNRGYALFQINICWQLHWPLFERSFKANNFLALLTLSYWPRKKAF